MSLIVTQLSSVIIKTVVCNKQSPVIKIKSFISLNTYMTYIGIH